MKHLKLYEDLEQTGKLKWPKIDKVINKRIDYIDDNVLDAFYTTMKSEYGGKGYKGKLPTPVETKKNSFLLNGLDGKSGFDEDRPSTYTFVMSFYPYKLHYQIQRRDEYELYLYVQNMEYKILHDGFLAEEAIYELPKFMNQLSDIVKLIDKNIEKYTDKSESYLKYILENDPIQLKKLKNVFTKKLTDKYEDDISLITDADDLGLL